MYYAMEHTYGATTGQETTVRGRSVMDHIGTVYAFSSRGKRDQWVEDGPDYTTDRGARTALSTRSAMDRRAIKAAGF